VVLELRFAKSSGVRNVNVSRFAQTADILSTLQKNLVPNFQ